MIVFSRHFHTLIADFQVLPSYLWFYLYWFYNLPVDDAPNAHQPPIGHLRGKRAELVPPVNSHIDMRDSTGPISQSPNVVTVRRNRN